MPFVPKILIIDDDPRMCNGLKVLLGSKGYEIQTRHNGQEALKALVKNDFDLVLLDLVLLDINGAEIMDHINSQTPETFVIVITGHASLDSAIDSLRKGAFDYLRKPFEYEELLKRVKNALDQKQLKREKKRVEEALRESEEKFRLAFENAKDAIFWANPETGLIANCNRAAEILLEKTRDEIIGQHQTTLHPSQKAQQYGDMFRRHIERKGSVDEEAEVITKSGKTIPVHITASVTSVGGIPIIQGIFRDVTERRRAEEALLTSHEKLQSLASELSLAEERQRRSVAIDVHDHIAQNLAFVKMKWGTLRPSIASGGALETMDEVLKLVDETIQNTRALISELGSPTLYELGFVPAVEWVTQQAQRQHGIVVDFQDDGQPKPLSEDVRVLLFQAARELLVNIAKHAKARTAKVSITRDGNQVRVDVEDDGIGFDSAETGSSVDTTGRFGLFSIRMRLEPLGGHMEVDSKPSHGTRVTLVAPLKHNGENKKEKVS